MPLSSTQIAILEFIKSEFIANQRHPTAKEIADQFGIKSTNGITYHLQKLKDAKKILIEPKVSRGIKLLNIQIILKDV